MDKKERFREWKRDMTVKAKSEYKKAKKSAKQAVAIAIKEGKHRIS